MQESLHYPNTVLALLGAMPLGLAPALTLLELVSHASSRNGASSYFLYGSSFL